MKLNRNTTLRFIEEGRYKALKCLYSHNFMETIPLYVSPSVNGILTIRLTDESFIVIVEERLYRKCSGKIPELLIMHNILTVYFDIYTNGELLTDLYCADWFGCNKVIKLLESMECMDRVKKLESYISRSGEFKVPLMKDILKTIKSVEVI